MLLVCSFGSDAVPSSGLVVILKARAASIYFMNFGDPASLFPVPSAPRSVTILRASKERQNMFIQTCSVTVEVPVADECSRKPI